jgi:hypothetical protein
MTHQFVLIIETPNNNFVFIRFNIKNNRWVTWVLLNLRAYYVSCFWFCPFHEALKIVHSLLTTPLISTILIICSIDDNFQYGGHR